MFSKIPPFFTMPNISAAGAEAAPAFAGMPLVNPLLNDAQTNIESLDERIQQLESVAQWLNLNLQMVNTTVQQLQVQKQTLQALAQWQELSKSTMESFSKINPFTESEKTENEPPEVKPKKSTTINKSNGTQAAKKATKATTKKSAEAKIAEAAGDTENAIEEEMPAIFEKMAQTWWDGLQNQFAQLAQPLVESAEEAANKLTEIVAAPTKAAAAKRKPKAATDTPKAKAAPKVAAKTKVDTRAKTGTPPNTNPAPKT